MAILLRRTDETKFESLKMRIHAQQRRKWYLYISNRVKTNNVLYWTHKRQSHLLRIFKHIQENAPNQFAKPTPTETVWAASFSSDFASCGFPLFRYEKVKIGERGYSNDEELLRALKNECALISSEMILRSIYWEWRDAWSK